MDPQTLNLVLGSLQTLLNSVSNQVRSLESKVDALTAKVDALSVAEGSRATKAAPVTRTLLQLKTVITRFLAPENFAEGSPLVLELLAKRPGEAGAESYVASINEYGGDATKQILYDSLTTQIAGWGNNAARAPIRNEWFLDQRVIDLFARTGSKATGVKSPSKAASKAATPAPPNAEAAKAVADQLKNLQTTWGAGTSDAGSIPAYDASSLSGPQSFLAVSSLPNAGDGAGPW